MTISFDTLLHDLILTINTMKLFLIAYQSVIDFFMIQMC